MENGGDRNGVSPFTFVSIWVQSLSEITVDGVRMVKYPFPETDPENIFQQDVNLMTYIYVEMSEVFIYSIFQEKKMALLRKCMVLVLFAGFPLTLQAEFHTPDTGTTYTLSSLSALAPGSLEKTPGGFLLKETLIISETDTLVARDNSLLITPREIENPIFTILVIEGRLIAENLVVTTHGNGLENYIWGCGLLIRGKTSRAEADITSCTFHTLSLGVIIRSGARIEIERCRFQDCYESGVYSYMEGEAIIRDSIFQNSNAIFSNSRGSIENCDFLDSNVNVYDLNNGFHVKGCHMEGTRDNVLLVYNGSGGEIRDTEIRGYHYGIALAGDACPTLLRNTIRESSEGAIVIGDKTRPVLRKNRITSNTLDPPSNFGPVILPAIFIMDGGAPDLGTSVTLGKNIIRYNGPVALYNAGMNRILAQGNYWEKDPENLIYHEPDDHEDADKSGFLSGIVEYAPLWSPFNWRLFLLY